jgi:hypothetical protein
MGTNFSQKYLIFSQNGPCNLKKVGSFNFFFLLCPITTKTEGNVQKKQEKLVKGPGKNYFVWQGQILDQNTLILPKWTL